MIRQLATALPALVLIGCSCQQEYAFPEADEFAAASPRDIGSWLSMDTAPDGIRLTMAYYDRHEGALRYAVGTPQDDGSVQWIHEAVDAHRGADGLNPDDRGKYASQKTAPDGTVWVAYTDVEEAGLYVAHRTSPGTWTVEEVDPGAGQWASLAIGADGYPVVAHQHAEQRNLRVSRFDGSSWTTTTAHTGQAFASTDPETGEPITRPADVGRYAHLYIAEDGTEYLAFHDAAQQTLDLLEGKDGNYVHHVVDRTGNVGQWPSILVEGNSVRIAYHDVGNQHLKLATRLGGSWSVETVDDGQVRGADTAIFTLDDQPAIVYFDGYMNDMVLATFDGGDWAVQTLGEEGAAVGFHNEVAVAGGKLWMGSYNYTDGTLFLANADALKADDSVADAE